MWFTGLALLVGYITLVRLVRFRRMRAVFDKYGHRGRLTWSQMSIRDAYEIQRALGQEEFPTVFAYSIIFALFKVRSTFRHVAYAPQD